MVHFSCCLIHSIIKSFQRTSNFNFKFALRNQLLKSWRCLWCARSPHWLEQDSYTTKGWLCPISLNKAEKVRFLPHSYVLENKTAMFCPCLLSKSLHSEICFWHTFLKIFLSWNSSFLVFTDHGRQVLHVHMNAYIYVVWCEMLWLYTCVHAQHRTASVSLAKGQPWHLSDPSVHIKLQKEI